MPKPRFHVFLTFLFAALATAANETIVLHVHESFVTSHLPALLPISTCQSRTINYITHTLPQQCATTSWTASRATPASQVAEREGNAIASTAEHGTVMGKAETTSSESVDESASEQKPSSYTKSASTADVALSSSSASSAAETPSHSSAGSSTGSAFLEDETDSPLDNANFLSFEEWKKQNLEKAGQNPDNVGQDRSSSIGSRRRPVNINSAIDALGEDNEIELDFGGFGSVSKSDDSTASWAGTRETGQGSKGEDQNEGAAASPRGRSKDAGKTCKERFNYASFDCAATVLKTNPQCKSSTSVLVENKDSYMLNECAAKNKFIIVELCNDILVDTVVLANFEFFSSIFRTFRVSVSDRYPVKLEKWRALGTFEARNTRDIQAFLIEQPLIWARYLRIEFLTHYGNEFYCPVSLLRVHGTTMIEEYRHEELSARGEDEEMGIYEPEAEAGGSETVQSIPPVTMEETKTAQGVVSDQPKTSEETPPERSDASTTSEPSESIQDISSETSQDDKTPENSIKSGPSSPIVSSKEDVKTIEPSTVVSKSSREVLPPAPVVSVSDDKNNTVDSETAPKVNSDTQSPGSSSIPSQKASVTGNAVGAGSSSQVEKMKPSSPTPDSSASSKQSPQSSHPSSASDPNSSSSTTITSSTASPNTPPRPPPSNTQPAPANPTTQESFFKSIHKRLSQLETNSSLSLAYIESQSRILRDAFRQVSLTQINKTDVFLQGLNKTVMGEFEGVRREVELLWQSTVLELEGLRERQEREVLMLTERLGVLGEEVGWQRRMAVVQSTLLLMCLGLVLFVRSGQGFIDSGNFQQIVNSVGSSTSGAASLTRKQVRGFETSPSPPESPAAEMFGIRRRMSKRMGRFGMWRNQGNSGGGVTSGSEPETDGRRSPEITFSSPTDDEEMPDAKDRSGSTMMDDGEGDGERKVVLETQSGPATPRGSRDKRPTWDGAFEDEEGEGGEGVTVNGRETSVGLGLEEVASKMKGRPRSPLSREVSGEGSGDDMGSDDSIGSLEGRG